MSVTAILTNNLCRADRQIDTAERDLPLSILIYLARWYMYTLKLTQLAGGHLGYDFVELWRLGFILSALRFDLSCS